ncbi:MAG: hypothetical protein JWQ87_1998 [Candidatus Sulfotelmatobacter sp.]|nr:hypothetical protein [Candidatus Sulfotelmatobacter sp.]
MAEQDNLVSQSIEQRDPYRVKGSDFSVTHVSPAHGQGSDSGEKTLVSQSRNQEGPRHAEESDSSDSMAGKEAAVSANFKVGRSAGESDAKPGDVAMPESVNLSTGHVEVKGVSQSRVKEVADRQVHLG